MAIRTGGYAHSGDGDEENARRRASTMMMEEGDRRELRRIATAMSQHPQESMATLSNHEVAPSGPLSIDPALDPSSKAFDLSKWLQSVIDSMREIGRSPKQAGVVYNDLSVSGTGAALQLQQTVGSFLQAPLRPGELFSFGKKQPKTILHSFDGMLQSGELLIVLGRPGSGCSTLLKTITGQLHGLSLGEGTTIHYNGIPQKKMIKEFKGETTYNQEVRNTPKPHALPATV